MHRGWRGTLITKPLNKGIKLTKPENKGASQLIPGVEPLDATNDHTHRRSKETIRCPKSK